MDTTIKLGNFALADLEIPQHINFGGKQQLAKHMLIGGNRNIDSMGTDPKDITWSGLFFGANALTRAQTLNQMKDAGIAINFTWFNLKYSVIIADFNAFTERYYQVSYDITLAIVADLTNPISANSNLTGVTEAVSNDIQTATSLATTIGIPAVTTAVAAVNNLIAPVASLNGATKTLISSIINPINNAIVTVENAIANITQNLFGS